MRSKIAAGILLFGLAAAPSAASSRAAGQVDLSRSRGVQSEPSIAVDPGNRNLLVAASQDLSVCEVRIYSSSDGGKRWSSTPLRLSGPAATRHAAGKPCAVNEWVAAGRQGEQYVVFLQRQGSGWGLYFAGRRFPQAWSNPTSVDAGDGFPDKPVVAVDNNPASPHVGRIYVAWTHWTAFGRDGQVLLASSDDEGETWSSPTEVGPAEGANWGVQLAVAGDGTLYASAWNGGAPGYLWITRSTDGGLSFEPLHVYASLVRAEGGVRMYVPAEPTQPIQSEASLTVDTSSGRRAGDVYAAYSRWTPNGHRIGVDVFGSGLKPELRKTISVRRTRRTYDEFDPTIAIDESNGTVWACFYVTGTGKQRVLAAYSCVDSRSGGRTWSRVLGGASVPSNETQHAAFNRPGFLDNDYGPYQGLAVSGGVAHPIWTDSRDLEGLGEEIYTTRVR